MELLQNKVVLITGGARGIGRSIAIAVAKQGAQVAFSDLRADENYNRLLSELRSLGVKAEAFESNAASFTDAEKLINDVYAAFGRIDVLVNNAGITRDNLLMRMTEEQWDMVINVNLKSVFNLTKAVQKIMLKQKNGSIINISSVVGVNGNAGQANYAASKAGIIGFTKSIAKELGSRNVRCNAIAPGFIETEMTAALPEDYRNTWNEKIALRRAGKPEDVADVVVFLGSDLSSYVTGQVISVCGGMI
ncbi:MAG TPA: 3-oxoacyl-[acyl-carrier-protein] reductase [Bacteroidales bacterium]|nr:3-oxoacyl-[acyl-carrier-protein] reductase [Bacteroidales bacterium]